MAASVLRGTPVAAKPQIFTRGKKVVTSAKLGNWLPGSDTPAYLENVTGSYGFDPLGLAATPAALQRFRESEVYHCRWAMLGVVGALGVEVLGYGNWYDAPLPLINGGHATYFGAEIPFDLGTLIAVELAGFAAAETIRGAGEPEARIYPGGAFDPVGLSKGDNVEEWKVKEIKNGRLAMLAFIGFVAAHAAGQGSPLEALAAHLANPAAANFATNGVSLPF
eukprot:scaffold20.g7665.t1